MFEPWRGQEYDTTRLLLLGESAYSWEEDGRLIHPSPHHPSDIVKTIIRDFNHDGQNFMRTLTRGLANEERPSDLRRKFVWDRVAFTNYVAGTVGRAHNRPTSEQWNNAKANFPDLLEQLRPIRLIVLGLDMWHYHMPTTAIGDGMGAQAYRLGGGELCWCLPLPHPSRRENPTTWRQLAAAVYFHYADHFSP